MFAPLFCQERQPVSSVFHIPTGFMHSSARDGGQHGFSTDRETVYSMQHKYIDSLPQCGIHAKLAPSGGRGKLCPEPVPPTKLIPNADLFKQHFNGYILFIHYSTSLFSHPSLFSFRSRRACHCVRRRRVQRIYGSGEMYWMTFPWPWPKVMAVASISKNMLICAIKWEPLIGSL